MLIDRPWAISQDAKISTTSRMASNPDGKHRAISHFLTPRPSERSVGEIVPQGS